MGSRSQAVIHGSPNGATPSEGNLGGLSAEFIGGRERTRGSETSQYPEEQKTTVIPLVAASERGKGQTRRSDTTGVVGPTMSHPARESNCLERQARDGDSPVSESQGSVVGT